MKADPIGQKVHVISMGCAKNLVDSEKLLAQVRAGGMSLSASVEDADVAVINTCGFIESAKQESIDMLLSVLERKTAGELKKVFAMGCLTERYRHELMAELPQLDGVFGSNELASVLSALGAELKYELLGERVLTSPRHSAYVKISEGCDNPCSFCAIPIMRGGHVSRPEQEILEEARLLVAGGTKELVVIGQDTTYYGLDTGGKRVLPRLLCALAATEGVKWIRVMYAYPAGFPLDLLDVIADTPEVCRYLDMPVQHCTDPILRSMRRGISARALRELIDRIKNRVPGIALRTTLIVGYPGETPKDFDQLLSFVEEFRFARLGVFPYSVEEGTTAFPLGDTVPQEEKMRRKEIVMELQREISERANEEFVGTRQMVLMDRAEDGLMVGRTERDAPEIDNEVYVHHDGRIAPGEMAEVDITDASEYDLYGTLPGWPTGS